MIKGQRVVCATCVNEDNRKCTIKKSTVSLNKRRRCDKYALEPTKVKERQILKTVKMGYKEKEALRREYKEQLKEFKAAARQGTEPRNMKNPLTGDLSRFISTAGKDRSGG
jgi:predicted DNA-binding protein (UPF0251 family)